MPSSVSPGAEPLLEALQAHGGRPSDFLSDVFTLLANNTNFYNISERSTDDVGYPPGVAERILVSIFRSCNPNRLLHTGNVFLPAAIAEEVEITTFDEDQYEDQDVESFSIDLDHTNYIVQTNGEADNLTEHIDFQSLNINGNPDIEDGESNADQHNDIPTDKDEPAPETSSQIKPADKQENSESYNGAVRDTFSWSQNICEMDVTIPLPTGIKSKLLDVNIVADSIRVRYQSNNQWETLVDDKLTHKIKPAETLWVMSEGCVRIHLEKQIEKWWDSLTVNEPKIDTATLNCSRPLHELSDEHMAKVREVQFNHMQRLAGMPTSEDIQKEDVLKRAWNLPGSPFANTPYDPNLFTQ